MATHLDTLAWKIHGQRSLVGCSPWGLEELDMTDQLHFHFSLSCIGEGNGSPLQCSCLENPKDRGAWWAAVYGVAQSDTTETTQQQQHTGCIVVACGIQFSDQGSNPGPLHWECGVLATRPPGKSLPLYFYVILSDLLPYYEKIVSCFIDFHSHLISLMILEIMRQSHVFCKIVQSAVINSAISIIYFFLSSSILTLFRVAVSSISQFLFKMFLAGNLKYGPP